MRVTDLVIHPDHPLEEAMVRLRDAGLTFGPVSEYDEIVGMISLDALAAKSGPLDAVNAPAVRDRMTTTVPYLYEDDPLALAVAVERSSGCRQFCVLDARRRLTGLFEIDESIRAQVAGPDSPAVAERARERIVVTASRATAAPPGRVRTFADAPTLYQYSGANRDKR